MVTIATNMAGRGTDIVLGGNLEAELAAAGAIDDARRGGAQGGLAAASPAGAGGRRPAYPRYRTPRIAPYRQSVARPRGPTGRPRSFQILPVPGRQPHAHFRVRPGQELYAGSRYGKGEAIEHRMVTNAIEKAQRKVEGATSIFASSCWSMTMWPTTSARSSTSSATTCWTRRCLGHYNRYSPRRGQRCDRRLHPALSVEEQWDIPGLEKQLEAEFAIAPAAGAVAGGRQSAA